MIYRTCPLCGANLDPGERCDCDVPTEKGRPAGTGTTQNMMMLPFAVYQAARQKSSCKRSTEGAIA